MKTKFLQWIKDVLKGDEGRVGVSFSISRQLAGKLESLAKKSEHPTLVALISSAIALYEWAFRRLDEGCVIVAIDPGTLRYHQLSVKHLIPSLNQTSNQEIGSTPALDIPDENDRLDRALKHYEWCLERKAKGWDIGAKSESGFETSPYV